MLAAVAAAADSHYYVARAYALKGRTADGTHAKVGVVAADPRVLPLGTRIRVSQAGRYSGDYIVRDTGQHVKGKRLDVYVPTYTAARRFGVRRVLVTVITPAQAALPSTGSRQSESPGKDASLRAARSPVSPAP